MSFNEELLELLVALSPLLLALIVICSKPKSLPHWVGSVLATAVLAVLATGFSMMRFVARCTNEAPPCEPDLISIPWQAGLIQPAAGESCFRCAPAALDTVTSLTITTNALVPSISVGVAALCVLSSTWMLFRLARWSRVNYQARQG